jgi:hypothetical protein
MFSNTVKLGVSIFEGQWRWAGSYAAMEIFLVATAIHEGNVLERKARVDASIELRSEGSGT